MIWHHVNTYFNYHVPLLPGSSFLSASLKMDCKDLYRKQLKSCGMGITHTPTKATAANVCTMNYIFPH